MQIAGSSNKVQLQPLPGQLATTTGGHRPQLSKIETDLAMSVHSPRLSKAGTALAQRGWGGAEREPDRAKPKYLFKVAKRPFRYSRSAPIDKERCANIYKVRAPRDL